MPDFANATVQTPLRPGGRTLGRAQTVEAMWGDRLLREYAQRMMQDTWRSYERRLATAFLLPVLPPLPQVVKGSSDG